MEQYFVLQNGVKMPRIGYGELEGTGPGELEGTGGILSSGKSPRHRCQQFPSPPSGSADGER